MRGDHESIYGGSTPLEEVKTYTLKNTFKKARIQTKIQVRDKLTAHHIKHRSINTSKADHCNLDTLQF